MKYGFYMHNFLSVILINSFIMAFSSAISVVLLLVLNSKITKSTDGDEDVR
jgi:hypothetical protein